MQESDIIMQKAEWRKMQKAELYKAGKKEAKKEEKTETKDDEEDNSSDFEDVDNSDAASVASMEATVPAIDGEGSKPKKKAKTQAGLMTKVLLLDFFLAILLICSHDCIVPFLGPAIYSASVTEFSGWGLFLRF